MEHPTFLRVVKIDNLINIDSHKIANNDNDIMLDERRELDRLMQVVRNINEFNRIQNFYSMLRKAIVVIIFILIVL
jgi:hypothetical protein